jgi:hypothetical protein
MLRQPKQNVTAYNPSQFRLIILFIDTQTRKSPRRLDTSTLETFDSLQTFDSKVKQFFVMIIFDELMLRHNVCSLSFSKIHTWIKKVLNTYGRYGGPKKLIGDQVQVFPTSSTRPPRHF